LIEEPKIKKDKMKTNNKTYTAKIYSLAFGGEGIGKVNEKIAFVRDAVPGDEVEFRVTKETSSFMKGELTRVIAPSGDRVDPVCAYYGRCGGCQLQHISYAKELYYKNEQVSELIKRIAGVRDFELQDIEPSADCYHYRTSITLNRKGDFYGYFTRDERDILKIKNCPIAVPEICDELASVAGEVKNERVTIKCDHAGRVWVSGRSGDRFYSDRYRGKDIFFSPRGFSQCNRHIAETVSKTLEEWTGKVSQDTAFFDAYCGVGFFSFLLEQDFCARIGMDSERVAIDCAKTTAKSLGTKNAKFFVGDVENEFIGLYKTNRKQDNIVLVDPPRKGVGKDFIEEIKSLENARNIYYISCDPAKLARDIKQITCDSEWRLGRVKPFDMFPRTKHIETLAEFVRK